MAIKANEAGICPHCKHASRFESANVDFKKKDYFNIYLEPDKLNLLELCTCPNCQNVIIFLNERMLYPLGSIRLLCPSEVPVDIASDYNEACLVEPLSKKSAAALARRCLQNMLHERGIKKKDLSQEIDEAMTKLPSHLSESIDSIRNIGNFAAHPMKSQQTGCIIDVEDGETEWILNVLEQLFDFYYVQPALTKAKKDALNAKLQGAGKPPMK